MGKFKNFVPDRLKSDESMVIGGALFTTALFIIFFWFLIVKIGTQPITYGSLKESVTQTIEEMVE